MKKIYFLFLSVILLFLVFINNSNNLFEKQETVFKEDNYDEDHYYISFKSTNCSTLNLLSYFDNLDIELEVIYPKNNLIIDDEKINKELFSFSYSTISNLTNSYLYVLEKYGLEEDIEKIRLYGIIISKVKIDSTKENLNLLLEKFPDLQYSYYLEGKYQ